MHRAQTVASQESSQEPLKDSKLKKEVLKEPKHPSNTNRTLAAQSQQAQGLTNSPRLGKSMTS